MGRCTPRVSGADTVHKPTIKSKPTIACHHSRRWFRLRRRLIQRFSRTHTICLRLPSPEHKEGGFSSKARSWDVVRPRHRARTGLASPHAHVRTRWATLPWCTLSLGGHRVHHWSSGRLCDQLPFLSEDHARSLLRLHARKPPPLSRDARRVARPLVFFTRLDRRKPPR